MKAWGLRAACAAAFAIVSVTASAEAPVSGPDSNLPVPRFVSLATENANGRHGPGLEHRIDWIYQRRGLPLQVTAESGPWRRVADPDGGVVWMHASNLAPKRTVLVLGEAGQNLALRQQPRSSARTVAYLEPGVMADLTGCDGDWRRVTVRGRVGWAHQSDFWGADACD